MESTPGYLGPIPNERTFNGEAAKFQNIGVLVYLLRISNRAISTVNCKLNSM